MLFSPVRVDEDERDPRRLIGERPELGHVDALGFERGPRLRPERVVPDRADERGRRAEPGGRHGLVAALAAVMLGEPTPGHGLPRRRQPVDGHDEVDVDRPHDDDRVTRSCAGDELAAVHADDVAVDEVGALAGQRQDRVRHVVAASSSGRSGSASS